MEASDLQRQLVETHEQQLRDSHALMSATQVPLQLAREAAAMASMAMSGGLDTTASGHRASMSSRVGGGGSHGAPDDDEVDVDGDLNESMLRSPGGSKPRAVRTADDEARRRERECDKTMKLCFGAPR